MNEGTLSQYSSDNEMKTVNDDIEMIDEEEIKVAET